MAVHLTQHPCGWSVPGTEPRAHVPGDESKHISEQGGSCHCLCPCPGEQVSLEKAAALYSRERGLPVAGLCRMKHFPGSQHLVVGPGANSCHHL